MPAPVAAPKARKPGTSNGWSVLVLGAAGFLAFVGGAWFFTPSRSPVDEEAPKKAEPVAEAELEPTIPAVNPRLTWANFQKINSGMTEGQIRGLLGQPTGADMKADGNLIRWEQSDPPLHVDVQFVNGRSTSRTTNLAPPDTQVSTDASPFRNVAGSAYKETREKYEQIQAGMTETELISLLGPPDHVASQSPNPSNTVRTLTWRPLSRYVTITVTLQNGGAVGRNWQQARK